MHKGVEYNRCLCDVTVGLAFTVWANVLRSLRPCGLWCCAFCVSSVLSLLGSESLSKSSPQTAGLSCALWCSQERCFSTFHRPPVCFVQLIFSPPFVLFFSFSAGPLLPSLCLHFYNLLKICVSGPAPCFLTALKPDYLSCVYVCVPCIGALCSRSVQWCRHESSQAPTSLSSALCSSFNKPEDNTAAAKAAKSCNLFQGKAWNSKPWFVAFSRLQMYHVYYCNYNAI